MNFRGEGQHFRLSRDALCSGVGNAEASRVGCHTHVGNVPCFWPPPPPHPHTHTHTHRFPASYLDLVVPSCYPSKPRSPTPVLITHKSCRPGFSKPSHTSPPSLIPGPHFSPPLIPGPRRATGGRSSSACYRCGRSCHPGFTQVRGAYKCGCLFTHTLGQFYPFHRISADRGAALLVWAVRRHPHKCQHLSPGT